LLALQIALQRSSCDRFEIPEGALFFIPLHDCETMIPNNERFNFSTDISHSTRQNDLRKRKPNATLVISEDAVLDNELKTKYNEILIMHDTISTYRASYVEDLTRRLGLDQQELPAAFSTATLLNPMFGRSPNIIHSGLMTRVQYNRARNLLVSSYSADGFVQPLEDHHYQQAEKELSQFEMFKQSKYIPELKYDRCISGVNEKGTTFKIGCGSLIDRGEDLPSKKNLADYLDKKGRIDLLEFFNDHKDRFPNLFTIVQREASRRAVEVGCERFFGLSGYISQPRRSRLNVRNYERLAMLAYIMQSVFIDPKWVADEYLRRCKAGKWSNDSAEDALKCFNFERILDAEVFGMEVPGEISLDDYMGVSAED
jgi:hypothetical protein